MSRKARWRLKQKLLAKEKGSMKGPGNPSPSASSMNVGIVGTPLGAKAVTLVSRAASMAAAPAALSSASPRREVVDLEGDRRSSPSRSASPSKGRSSKGSPGGKGLKSQKQKSKGSKKGAKKGKKFWGRGWQGKGKGKSQGGKNPSR
eukprot:2606298-Karenia_brevis.AAC.1